MFLVINVAHAYCILSIDSLSFCHVTLHQINLSQE